MKNQNDLTSEFYDLQASYLKSEEETILELKSLKQFVTLDSEILDIACGTGRHLIPLINEGYKVDGIDSSVELINILKSKLKKSTKIINADFFNFKFNKKYDFIYLMWNSLSELCTTKKDLIKFIKKIKKLLKPQGKILINIDNPNIIDPQNFNIELDFHNKFDYKYLWKTHSYNKKTNTSIAKESVLVFNKSELIQKRIAFIKQRFWSFEDLQKLFLSYNLNIQNLQPKWSGELYLLGGLYGLQKTRKLGSRRSLRKFK